MLVGVVGDSVSRSVDKAVSTASVSFQTSAAVTLASLEQTVHQSVSVTGTVTVRVRHSLTAASVVTTIHGSVPQCKHDA